MPVELPAHVLELSGPDAVAFAQAQFASDLRELAREQWQWSAWLSAQGRVRCWFAMLRPGDERLLLWLRGGDAARLRDELARYVFRSKLSLRVAAELRAYGLSAAEASAPPGATALARHGDALVMRLPDDRCVMLSPEQPATGDAPALAAWQLADIRAGLPELAPALQDQLLPQWLGLDRLNAINVGKGCYPGQEIMARLHFKGGNKRGLCRLAFRADALPQPGADVAMAGGEPGIVVQSAWSEPPCGEALAVLSRDAMPSGAPFDQIQVVSRFG